jgi:hypothetical protein
MAVLSLSSSAALTRLKQKQYEIAFMYYSKFRTDIETARVLYW